MRRLAPALCATLALLGSGCAGHKAPPPPPAPVVAKKPALDRASHGSAAFGRFVRANEPQLQYCYREARATSPQLAGSATVVVTLAADGTVRNADIVRRSWSGGEGSELVESCMLSRVRNWKFPAYDPDDLEEDQEAMVHSFAVIFSS